MNLITPTEITVIDSVPKYLVDEVFRRMPEISNLLARFPNRAVIAGGCFRAICAGEGVKDYDIFVPDSQTAREVMTALGGWDSHVSTDRAYTITKFNPPVQVIHRYPFTLPQDVIAGFDFTISQASAWFDEKGELHTLMHPEFENHALQQVLHYTHPVGNDVFGSFARLLKFYRAGYNAPRETLADMLAACCQGMRSETLLGTESNLSGAFLRRLPKMPHNS